MVDDLLEFHDTASFHDMEQTNGETVG